VLGTPFTHFDVAGLPGSLVEPDVPLPPELELVPPEELPLPPELEPLPPVLLPVAPVPTPFPAPEPCDGVPFGPVVPVPGPPTAGPSIFPVQPVTNVAATKRPRLQVNMANTSSSLRALQG
jgi:hypothetical protein